MIRHASEVCKDQEEYSVARQIEKAAKDSPYSTQTTVTIKEQSTIATLKANGYQVIHQYGYSYLVIWQIKL